MCWRRMCWRPAAGSSSSVRSTMARPARRPGNLPAEATSFIGRRRELAEVKKKLPGASLVSLVGPGGVGKTRLAVRAATDLGRGFPAGAWLVELAEVRDPALVGNAVMAALDLRDQAASEPLALLLSYLRDKQLLLVVDNCEHLLDAAARLVTEVLRAAPRVRLISTSREPLSVPGEHVVPVPPLDLPSADAAVPLPRLRQNEAVRLFAERAAAGSGSFELTAANRAAVVDVCRRLDGLPLAIELAAVRTRVLTALALDVLSSLVDKSLVLKEDVKEIACYRLHETMREYAGLKLREAGEEEAVELRCAAYYRGKCLRGAAEARYRLVEWLEWMDLEIDNIRSVLQRCIVHQDSQRGLDLASFIGWYWVTRATSEGIRWLDELLGSGNGHPRAPALAHFMRGFLAILQSDPTAARPALDRAATTAQEAGQVGLQSQSLSLASIAHHMAGDRTSARRLLETAQVITTGLDDFPPMIALLEARALGGLF